MSKMLKYLILFVFALSMTPRECRSQLLGGAPVDSFIGQMARTSMRNLIASPSGATDIEILRSSVMNLGFVFYARNVIIGSDTPAVPEWFVPASEQIVKLDERYSIGLSLLKSLPFKETSREVV